MLVVVVEVVVEVVVLVRVAVAAVRVAVVGEVARAGKGSWREAGEPWVKLDKQFECTSTRLRPAVFWSAMR